MNKNQITIKIKPSPFRQRRISSPFHLVKSLPYHVKNTAGPETPQRKKPKQPTEEDNTPTQQEVEEPEQPTKQPKKPQLTENLEVEQPEQQKTPTSDRGIKYPEIKK